MEKNPWVRRLTWTIGFALALNTAFATRQSDETEAFLYATRLMQDGMYNLAATQFKEYVENYPYSPKAPEAQFLLGECLFKSKKYAAAAQEFQNLCMKYSNFHRLDEAQYYTGQSYQKLKNWHKAVEAYQRVPMFYPKSGYAARALLQAANIYLKVGELERAAQSLRQILQDYPNSDLCGEARLHLARVLYQKNDFRGALHQLDRLLETTKTGETTATAQLLKGQIWETLSKLTEATKIYNSIVNQKKVSEDVRAKAYLRLGILSCKMGQLNKAKEYFTNGLSIARSTSRQKLLFQLAKADFDLGNYETALKFLQELVASSRDSVLQIKGNFLAGRACEQLQDFSAAVNYFEQVVKSAFDSSEIFSYIRDAYLHLVDDYLKLRKPALAQNWAQQFLLRFHHDVFSEKIQWLIGQIDEVFLAAPKKALQHYQQLLRSFPKGRFTDEAALGIARCQEKLQNWRLAEESYRQFIQQFPGSRHYLEAKQRLQRLTEYRPIDLEQTVHRLSALIGTLLVGQNREDAFYILIKLNFEDLKDYSNTIHLAKLALAKNLVPSYRRQVCYLLATSYFRLYKDETDTTNKAALRDSTIKYCRSFLEHYSDANQASLVALKLTEILTESTSDSTDAGDTNTYLAYRKLYVTYPNNSRQDVVLFRLGEILATSDSFPSDSLGNARQYFQNLQKNFPHSPYTPIALFRQAEIDLKLGHLSQAIKKLEQYVQRYPDGENVILAHYQISKIAYSQKDYSTALQHLDAIISQFYYSDYVDSARLYAGEIYFLTGDYVNALKTLDWLQRTKPQLKEQVLYKQGIILFKQKKLDEAEAYLRQYVGEFPNGEFIRKVLGYLAEIAKLRQDWQQAVETYQILLSRFPNSLESFAAEVKLADLLFDLGKFKEALGHYQKALTNLSQEYDPMEIEARSILCLLKLGQITKADMNIRQFKKRYKKLNRYLAKFEYEKGNYYLNNRNFELAIKSFKRILSKYKKTKYVEYAKYSLGKVYLILNRTEEGLKILTRIPRHYPDSEVLPLVYLTLGDFYYKTKKFENAISAFKRVLKLHPDANVEQTATQYLIKVYSDLGIYDSALMMVRQYLQKFPNAADALEKKIQMGIFYINLNEYNRAIEHLRSLLDEADRETEAEIQYWIGKSYFKMGQFEKAIAEYLKVSYLAKPTKLPWDVTAEYESGLAYMKLGELDKAQAIFDKIVKRYGAGSDYGRVALRKIEEIKQLRKEER